MIDQKIARVKELIRQREEIDAELKALFGGAEAPRRGRPRKDQSSGISTSQPVSESLTESIIITKAEPPNGK
jgi:hypothetical protein